MTIMGDSSLFNQYCRKSGRAHFQTSAALDAPLLFNHMRLALGALYALHRAFPGANSTTGAFFRVNAELNQAFALAGRTLPVENMGLVLIPKITQGSQNRIGGPLAQPAQRSLAYLIGQFFQVVDIFRPAFTIADPLDNVQHTPGANPALHAFAAGLLLGEIEEIAGHIHHTSIFIDHYHPA
jgi:hypothetical protein